MAKRGDTLVNRYCLPEKTEAAEEVTAELHPKRRKWGK
jgi:hypothetical protein